MAQCQAGAQRPGTAPASGYRGGRSLRKRHDTMSLFKVIWLIFPMEHPP